MYLFDASLPSSRAGDTTFGRASLLDLSPDLLISSVCPSQDLPSLLDVRVEKAYVKFCTRPPTCWKKSNLLKCQHVDIFKYVVFSCQMKNLTNDSHVSSFIPAKTEDKKDGTRADRLFDVAGTQKAQKRIF